MRKNQVWDCTKLWKIE